MFLFVLSFACINSKLYGETLIKCFFLALQPPEKANDDGLIFPWKHREVLTFDIPVHDTEKAGLGKQN